MKGNERVTEGAKECQGCETRKGCGPKSRLGRKMILRIFINSSKTQAVQVRHRPQGKNQSKSKNPVRVRQAKWSKNRQAELGTAEGQSGLRQNPVKKSKTGRGQCTGREGEHNQQNKGLGRLKWLNRNRLAADRQKKQRHPRSSGKVLVKNRLGSEG